MEKKKFSIKNWRQYAMEIFVLRQTADLSSWEDGFLRSIYRQLGGDMSPRQEDCLKKIISKYYGDDYRG